MNTVVLLLVALLLIVLLSAVWKIHPVPVLLGAGLFWGLACGFGPEATLKTLAAGFGKTMEGIGLVIIAGTVIGLFMEKRGALGLLAERTLQITGPKRVPSALAMIGFITSIPIFCDSAFVILIGLVRSICRRVRLPLAVGVTALALGLFAAHCVVPPTPGPVAAAALLKADLGLTILFGLVAALAATIVGRFFAAAVGKSVVLKGESDNNATPGLSSELSSDVSIPTQDGSNHSSDNAFHNRDVPATPVETIRHFRLGRCALPILVPLLMVLAGSFFTFLAPDEWKTLHQLAARTIEIAGLPVVALGVGAFLSIFCLGRRTAGELSVDGLFGEAVRQAAVILVITASGGAFGELLRANLKFGDAFTFSSGGGAWLILLPAAVSAFIKTAQGSSTVAILTTAGIFAPMLEPLGLDSEALRALCVVAIGSGAMIVSHANDSYFWVVTGFSGMSVRQGLRLLTLGSLAAGLTAACVCAIMAACVA